jgi:uracil-DNA glycosylase family 4
VKVNLSYPGLFSFLDEEKDLEELKTEVLKCSKCHLRNGCTQVVFDDGNPTVKLMLIGEAPGADEDRIGRPFVGKAGQLLDNALKAAGFSRKENVYITNVVKCRPPQNRIPTPVEQEICKPYLLEQIRIIKPSIIILLGATAVGALIDPNARITKIRGNWIEKDGIWYMPTFHPAALLRNPNWKVPFWEDLKGVIDKYRILVDPNHYTEYHPIVEG